MKRAIIIFLGIIVVFLSVFTLFATSKKEEVVNLVFRQMDTPSEAAGLKRAVEVFNQENPNIQVEMETLPHSEARDQLLREAATKEGPDVLQIAFVWTRDLGIAGALMPLDSFIESDPDISVDDFVAMDLTEYEGKHYGIPWTVDTFTMAYRKDILEKAGITSLPKTWDEFYETSKKIKEKTGKYGFGYPAGSGSAGTLWFLANYYWWSQGISLIEKSPAGEYYIGVTVDDVVEVMKFFHSFIKEGHTPEAMLGVENWADPEVTTNFAEGNTAMAFLLPYTLSAVIEKAEEGAVFVSGRVPAGRDPDYPNSHAGGRTLGMNANTKYPDESWKLLKFLLSEKVFKEFYTQYYPASKTLLKAIEVESAYQGYLDQIAHARTWLDFVTSPAPVGAMWDRTSREFGEAFIGRKSYEEAANDLLAFVKELLEGK